MYKYKNNAAEKNSSLSTSYAFLIYNMSH